MLRKPTISNTFTYKPETGLNPYIGLMSFQHFRGEALYSDCVVRPENNLCETENFECYPVPENVEENGRQEGYYPEGSVVYIRILWKEFEPEQGAYRYEFIEDILKKAKEHKQTMIFRLMAHSTRSQDDVPEWLKEMMECPKRPEGMRVKDSPTDPRFLEYFGQAIRKIGERFDKDPFFEAIDISLPGAWGEGHNLHLYSDESIIQLIDTYLDVFKETQLIGQLARPNFLHYVNAKVNVGWRGDGLGHPPHTENVYPPLVEQVSELWKTGPVSFEAYWWLGEWQRKRWSIDAIIKKTLEWHISSFNGKSLPIPMEWKDKIDYWISKMGYHYGIEYFKCPSEACPLDDLEFKLGIVNHGVAPIYKKIPVYIKLESKENSFCFETSIDMRKWLPGKTEESFIISLPKEIAKGEYDINIGMYDKVVSQLYLCMDAVCDEGFYKLGTINIELKGGKE